MKRENSVLVIAGPSGVGKTVVAKAMVEKDNRFTFLRSGTTRKRRGDSHDDEYLYFTEEEFLAAVDRGEFAEHMRYGGNLYGTPNSELRRAIDGGKIPLMVLELNGAKSLYNHKDYSACCVYVYADKSIIDKRLYDRCLSENPDGEKGLMAYKSRTEENERDFSCLPEFSECFFDFVTNEGTVDECAEYIADIFKGFTEGIERNSDRVETAINYLKNTSK